MTASAGDVGYMVKNLDPAKPVEAVVDWWFSYSKSLPLFLFLKAPA
jgi:hypothetical protein